MVICLGDFASDSVPVKDESVEPFTVSFSVYAENAEPGTRTGAEPVPAVSAVLPSPEDIPLPFPNLYCR